jgi:hypothetical protein
MLRGGGVNLTLASDFHPTFHPPTTPVPSTPYNPQWGGTPQVGWNPYRLFALSLNKLQKEKAGIRAGLMVH